MLSYIIKKLLCWCTCQLCCDEDEESTVELLEELELLSVDSSVELLLEELPVPASEAGGETIP